MYRWICPTTASLARPRFQFDNKQLLLVLADGEQIDWTGICWKLLPT